MEEKSIFTKTIYTSLAIGGLGYLSFVLHFLDYYLMFFIAPSIRLAYQLKTLIGWTNSSVLVNYFLFLLPIVVLYHFLAGFLFDRIEEESGWVKHFTALAYSAFLIAIHFVAWSDIVQYLS